MKKVQVNSLYCYGFIFLLMLIYGFNNTEIVIPEIVKKMCVYGAFFLVALSITMRKYRMMDLLKLVLLCAFAVSSYFITHETIYSMMIFGAIIVYDCDYCGVLKLIFYERLFIILIIVGGALSGMLSLGEITILKGGVKATMAWALGYNHPNQLATQVGFLILLFICIKNSKLNNLNISALILTTVATFALSKSRTFIFISLFAIIICWLLQHKITQKYVSMFLEKFSIFVMPACAVIALGVPCLMTTATGKFQVYLWAINGDLGSRFTHASRVFENYDISLFGSMVDFEKLQILYNYSIVDDGYVQLLYNFGIFGSALFIILYILTIKRLIKKQEYVYIIAIMCIAMWGISENVLRSLATNFTVLFWSELMKNRQTFGISEKRWKRHMKIRFKRIGGLY